MIDRYNLVNRNNPVLKEKNINSPFTVGNGEFAFTADITGLQTFYSDYTDRIPINTMAQWGWHNFNDQNYSRKNLKLKKYMRKNKSIYYASDKTNQESLFDFLRQNPHKFNLARIGLFLQNKKGEQADLTDIKLNEQKLDLWQGILLSDFEFDGKRIKVETICDPVSDSIAVNIKSELFNSGNLGIEIEFPYPSVEKSASNWDNADNHRTILQKLDEKTYKFNRLIDNSKYFVLLSSSKELEKEDFLKHKYLFRPAEKANSVKFVINFNGETSRNNNYNFDEIRDRSINYWHKYWSRGGIIDFSKTDDLRAQELERRMVLSQYLTAVQCAGTLPPAETGLTSNSWYGKFHLEMHFWHSAHFVLWQRESLLEKSLWWYYNILDKAKELAKSQGFKGARWPKMVGPEGYDSPSSIGPFLIWQQPHPIIYAELLYRRKKEKTVLKKYYELVEESVNFMKSYLLYDEVKSSYNLAGPLIPAQESYNEKDCLNPTFELEYWQTAFIIAQNWRKRLGLKENKNWNDIINKFADLPIHNNLYIGHENAKDTFINFNIDHPSMLGAFGLLSGLKVNKEVMHKTFNKVLQDWQFNKAWGWDFPMTAMTAAKLGEKEKAVDILLMDSPKNTYLINGHNQQGNRKDLPLYLPGNGGFLLALGMMAAGWDNKAGENNAFPDNWLVEYESIDKYI